MSVEKNGYKEQAEEFAKIFEDSEIGQILVFKSEKEGAPTITIKYTEHGKIQTLCSCLFINDNGKPDKKDRDKEFKNTQIEDALAAIAIYG